MKANELRIGNLVTVDNKKYHPSLKGVVLEITSISKNSQGYVLGLKHINQQKNVYYESYSQYIHFCKPIALTEDELLRLGFTCDENKMYRNDRICVNWGNWGTVTILGPDGGYVIPFQHKNQTVHWIQNLYFALTRKELIYKP